REAMEEACGRIGTQPMRPHRKTEDRTIPEEQAVEQFEQATELKTATQPKARTKPPRIASASRE
ncbi:hypothetical protein, partial [Glycomyces terrestris]|uniref:hypothetical protein n=1 Tax=Glycomyces terrestris TaxID=2493553 RepID=UPI00131568FF